MEEKKLGKVVPSGIKLNIWLQFLSAASAAIVFSFLASLLNLRLDLTEDHRFTLADPTKRILSNLKNDVYLQVWLEGEMPVQFKKLKRSVKEMLDEFRIVSGRKLDYEFLNPSDAKDAKSRNTRYEELLGKGLNPVNIQAKDEEGGSSQRIIFPGMIVNYNGVEIPVNFLKNNPTLSPEQNFLHSMEGLEYEMIQTISTITSDSVYKVAFIEGHNEMPEIEVADLILSLARYFTVDRGAIGGTPGILDRYAAVVVAGPESSFPEKDKFVIDQYIMKGGKVMWLYDEVRVNEDSLAYGETVALYRPLNLEDQLFRYGVRVNPSVVQDLNCIFIPLKVVTVGTQQQIVPVPWLYYPKLIPSSSHPITRNINSVIGKYSNYIDTVGLDPGIKKTVLLSTSQFSRIINPPALVSLKEAERTPGSSEFTRSNLPVAVLLSGKFQSAFSNRMISGLTDDRNFRAEDVSVDTKMIVIADNDIIRNDVSYSSGTAMPLTLGQDRYTLQTYGNKDFLVNCLNYLVDEDDIIDLRSREIKLRLLDKNSVKQNHLMIILVNLVLPVIIVAGAGMIYGYLRRRMYTKNRQ